MRYPSPLPDQSGEQALLPLLSARQVHLKTVTTQDQETGIAQPRKMSIGGDVAEQMARWKDDERARIARGLHDDVLQDLLYALQSWQVAELHAVENGEDFLYSQQVDCLRRAVLGLQQTLYNLEREGARPCATLLQLIGEGIAHHRTMAPGLQIRLKAPHDFPSIPVGTAALELMHIVQEALVNVRRHASARHVDVALTYDDQDVWIDVVDDGCGFDTLAQAPGFGLTCMQQRATLIDAELHVVSELHRGTVVCCRVALATLNAPVEEAFGEPRRA